MLFSLTTILIVATIVILSVAIGNISTIIRVHVEPSNHITLNISKDSNPNDTIKFPIRKISTSYDDLIWFLQISDIHISIFRDMSRISDLQEFCQVTLDAIKPMVVLASGDLTDAKSIDTLGSQQYEDEWKLYRNALDTCQVDKKTVWLDVRGNHDNFNVRGPKAKENYYRNYSVQGGANPRSYLHTIRTAGGKVFSFIAMDACLEPGPKRPFNFFGLVNERETEHLKSLVRKAAEAGSSHSVWFGHYPTSCVLSADPGVRLLIASDPRVQAYLCGHLHTMGGIVPHMYTLQQAGFLELELADWKDSRVYRVAAIDHGLFSFIDVHHKEWPIALITNPKHALFYVPGREPDLVSASSTHIRVLVFSTAEITSVKIKIDDEDWQYCHHVKGPLYVNAWHPDLYLKDLHYIKVEVSDKAGRTGTYEQPFSLDGTRPSFLIIPRILLMMNFTTIFQVLFGLGVVACVLPLSLLRILLTRIRGGKRQIPTTNVSLISRWYRRLWILANLDRFFYPLILYPIYICFGPWAVGEIIDDYIGVIFAWGTFVNGAYLPGSFTYGYGFFQIAAFQFPLTLALAHQLDRRLLPPPTKPHSKLWAILRHWWADSALYIVLLLQLLFLYFFWLSYGSLATLLGPFRSWPIVVCVCLWRRIHQTPLHTIKELAEIFQEAAFGSPRLKPSRSI
uniref:Uncharacterized protein n=2 Tax=Graphocephala atropunctata TaxID=36148 RepID=A0A1B6LP93_9HEMI